MWDVRQRNGNLFIYAHTKNAAIGSQPAMMMKEINCVCP